MVMWPKIHCKFDQIRLSQAPGLLSNALWGLRLREDGQGRYPLRTLHAPRSSSTKTPVHRSKHTSSATCRWQIAAQLWPKCSSPKTSCYRNDQGPGLKV